MHCLSAVSGGAVSPKRAGSSGSVLGVIRALGVLVSEGRVQGPPRGYKEGPHCAAPMQAIPNDHVCEENNYLCDRYVILVREIAERVTNYSYLCVEVLLCSDCPCGLAKSTTRDPVLPIPSISIIPWQQSSEMLLEYWYISVVPSKGPEMMNNQSLYQAVRSRLHFSQVAAWWSRSKGVDPSYISTRIVPYSEDNLRKFRETPSEHTFPLASCGDGKSIKVTVWALPRLEDVPVLSCPIHPVSKEDGEAARALTPTKNLSVPLATSNSEALVLPSLVDDRLQTPCNEPGKHHCRCEEEDGCPPSPSTRANSERKRRRSLPRGPDLPPTAMPHTSVPIASVLPSVCEQGITAREERMYIRKELETANTLCNELICPDSSSYRGTNIDNEAAIRERQDSSHHCCVERESYEHISYLENQIYERQHEKEPRSYERHLSSDCHAEEAESNVEKRYKCSVEPFPLDDRKSRSDNNSSGWRRDRSPKYSKKDINCSDKPCTMTDVNLSQLENGQESFSGPSSLLKTSLQDPINGINWITSTINRNEAERDQKFNEKPSFIESTDKLQIIIDRKNFVNPFGESSPFHESNPGPSSYHCPKNCPSLHTTLPNKISGIPYRFADTSCVPSVSLNNLNNKRSNDGTWDKNSTMANSDLSQLMSKLKLSDTKDRDKEEGGILDWISRVPARVLGVGTSNGLKDCELNTKDTDSHKQETGVAKSRPGCNLELSQREFDEVLAVLRTRTPSSRRRTPFRAIKRRDRAEKHVDESHVEQKTIFKPMAASSNISDSMTRNDIHKVSIADELGREQLYKNAKCPETVPSVKRVGVEIVRKNNRKSDKLTETNEYQGRHPFALREKIAGEKNQEGPNQSDYSNTYSTLEKKNQDKTTTKPNECYYVTNKADALLGAILRTSKDSRKGLSDISNGARPRTAVGNEPMEMETKINGAIKPLKDESSPPSSLNKRLFRFRELFKKEHDRKPIESLTTENDSEKHATNYQKMYNTSKSHVPDNFKLSRKGFKESRVQRRIDFSKFPESADRSVNQNESLVECSETSSSTNSVCRNPLFHSTDYATESLSAKKNTSSDDVLQTSEPNNRCKNYKEKNADNDRLIRMPGYENECSATNTRNSDETENGNAAIQNGFDVENSEMLDKVVPSAIEQERFRRSLGNAASMVFHSRTGLPLTSSPAPLRRGRCCFDYDSTLNSVSSKRSALFELNTPPSPGAVSLEEGDRETENTCEGEETTKRRTSSRRLPHSHALLGSFEESALNGRLEPVSTVHGFTAEIGASGSFCPKHKELPVTVFFYTLGDNDKVSTPYLAHINLGKKGYQVPRSGTIQVTLLNPLGTVVKMFVVMYDLSDMPARSHTFLRQRTLRDKTLRYLIHLRFMSGKSGRIHLHTDIRMIICRKSDVDTASDFGAEPPKELRSFLHGPTNPKFSPRC